jgi:hypothetical protein
MGGLVTLPQHGEHALAEFRQMRQCAFATKQLATEFAFKVLDGARQGRLCHAAALCSLGQIQRLADRQKVSDMVHFHSTTLATLLQYQHGHAWVFGTITCRKRKSVPHVLTRVTRDLPCKQTNDPRISPVTSGRTRPERSSVECQNRSRLISSAARRKYQTNLHDNNPLPLEIFYREACKVDMSEPLLQQGFPTAGHMSVI